MNDQKNQEIYDLHQEDDFTSFVILDTINSLWKLVVNFLDRIRDGILTAFITNKNLLYLHMDCDQCFHVDVTMETPCLLQSAMSRCLKTPPLGKCSVRRVGNRAIPRKNAVDIHNEIFGALQNLSLSDADENKGDKTANLAKVGSACKDCILRNSRITLSDFTASFNEFVRQNGRDFSKSDLAWWFDKFTQYIYLKEMFHGDPTNLREQLLFRSIQSKRDSIMQRLYPLREKHELHLTAEEFYKRLKAQSLDPVQKLTKDRHCCGDTNETKENGCSGENKLSTESSEKEGKQLSAHADDEAAINDCISALHASSEVRAETIDLEKEKHIQDTAKDIQQQTTMSQSRTKRQKKRTPKTKMLGQENEVKYQHHRTELYSHFSAKSKINPFDPKHLPPCRDQSKCLNSTIYITRNGLVQVSQYMESNSKFKKVSGTGYEQERTINFYVDHLDEKDPLPPNVEVKPLPPGGLDEVLRNVPPMTKEEMDELNRITSLAEKELHHLRAHCEKLDNPGVGTQGSTDVSEPHNPGVGTQGSTDVTEPQTEQYKELKCVRTRHTRKSKAVPQYHKQNPLPFSPLLEAGIQQQFVKDIVNTVSPEPGFVEQESAETTEPPAKCYKCTKVVLPKKGDTSVLGVVAEHKDQNMKPDHKMRRFVPLKRRPTLQTVEATTEPQTKETPDDEFEKVKPIAPENELQNEHLFDQIPPLNFIDTDTVNEECNATQKPVYLETNATIDYSRHVVEPSHGDRPNKKKLQAKLKEKIKTKGEANKHLKVKQEKTAYYFEGGNAGHVDMEEDNSEEESDLDASVAEHTEDILEPLIVSATDQPQVQDTREYMMVPEEIRRLDDSRLKDIEDKYSLASNIAKKDKKKKKDKKNKIKKNIPFEYATDFHV